MKKLIYRANSRGHFKNEWLNTKYSFSFADYHDRNRMNFGVLRVLNDDIIKPGTGFGMHPHDNMEIITIPLKGSLKHKDSMGNIQALNPNEVQVMSAGTGIFHSEFNDSDNEEVELFQIWIYPALKNIVPSYDQKVFDTEDAQNKWQLLVSGFETKNGSLTINQNAKISRVFLKAGKELEYKIDNHSLGCFLMVASGEIEIDNEILNHRDTIGITECGQLKIKAKEDSFIINIEVVERN